MAGIFIINLAKHLMVLRGNMDLRECQTRAIESARNVLRGGKKRLIIHAPLHTRFVMLYDARAYKPSCSRKCLYIRHPSSVRFYPNSTPFVLFSFFHPAAFRLSSLKIVITPLIFTFGSYIYCYLLVKSYANPNRVSIGYPIGYPIAYRIFYQRHTFHVLPGLFDMLSALV